MAELLVSVRSITEAEVALAGGAAIIDIKEPILGSLGRAAESTIAAVIEFINGLCAVRGSPDPALRATAGLPRFRETFGQVNRRGRETRAERLGRVPVSAALGELAQTQNPFEGQGLTYAKWGLAGCGPRWREELKRAGRRQQALAPECRIVAVAYADWRLAKAPCPAEVFEFVHQVGWQTMLIDTWRKNGKTLLDWMPPFEVEQLCHDCRGAGIRLALAGSLGPKEIQTLLSAQPDIFAVRGAVCRRNNRREGLDPIKIRRLVQQLRPAQAISEN